MVSDDQGKLAIYGVQRSTDHALTLVSINKSETDLTSTLSLRGFQPTSTAQVYHFSRANLKALVRQPDQAVQRDGFTATYPARSATIMVLPHIR